MKKIACSLILYFVFVSCSFALESAKGYNIKIKINGLSETDVILGHFVGNSMYPDDTVRVDTLGEGVFNGSEDLVQGLYFIYLENGSNFEIVMGADQVFIIETDTVDYVRNLKFEGSPDNKIFNDFKLFMFGKSKEADEIQAKLKEEDKPAKKEKLREQMAKMVEERIKYIKSIQEENPDLFVGVFLNATIDIEVPEELQRDRKLSYQYIKKHYFDNLDLSDVRMMYTPVYENRLINYMDKIVLQIPDSINKEIDFIIEKSRSDSALFRYVMVTLFKKYANSNVVEDVLVHLAKVYYIPEAWWSGEKYIEELKKRVDALEPLLYGKIAPDVQLRYVPSDHFKQAANDTALKKYQHSLSFFNIIDIDAEFTVLLFLDATCSHCKHDVPEFYRLYEDSLKTKNVKVVAISTLFGEDGKEKWVDFVNKKQLYDWINAWNPYDFKFKEAYDIRTNPQFFVLNKDKEIIGKRLGGDNVVELVNRYKKYNTD